jgi:hypothetical protein
MNPKAIERKKCTGFGGMSMPERGGVIMGAPIGRMRPCSSTECQRRTPLIGADVFASRINGKSAVLIDAWKRGDGFATTRSARAERRAFFAAFFAAFLSFFAFFSCALGMAAIV